jgi:hypothetical protein
MAPSSCLECWTGSQRGERERDSAKTRSLQERDRCLIPSISTQWGSTQIYYGILRHMGWSDRRESKNKGLMLALIPRLSRNRMKTLLLIGMQKTWGQRVLWKTWGPLIGSKLANYISGGHTPFSKVEMEGATLQLRNQHFLNSDLANLWKVMTAQGSLWTVFTLME